MKKLLIFSVFGSHILFSQQITQDNFAQLENSNVSLDFNNFVMLLDYSNPHHIIHMMNKSERRHLKSAIEDALDKKLMNLTINIQINEHNNKVMRRAVLSTYNNYCLESFRFYLKILPSHLFIGALVGAGCGYLFSTLVKKITGWNLNMLILPITVFHGLNGSIKKNNEINAIDLSYKVRNKALKYIRRRIFADQYFDNNFNILLDCKIGLPHEKVEKQNLIPYFEHYYHAMLNTEGTPARNQPNV